MAKHRGMCFISLVMLSGGENTRYKGNSVLTGKWCFVSQLAFCGGIWLESRAKNSGDLKSTLKCYFVWIDPLEKVKNFIRNINIWAYFLRVGMSPRTGHTRQLQGMFLRMAPNLVFLEKGMLIFQWWCCRGPALWFCRKLLPIFSSINAGAPF